MVILKTYIKLGIILLHLKNSHMWRCLSEVLKHEYEFTMQIQQSRVYPPDTENEVITVNIQNCYCQETLKGIDIASCCPTVGALLIRP